MDDNGGFRKERTVSKGKGCLFLIIGFLASCFVGVIIILSLIIYLVFGAVERFADKPLSKDIAYKKIYQTGTKGSKNKIAIVKIYGIILNSDDTWGTIANSQKICKELKKAAEDKSIKGVILDIDSPGGEIVATDNIYHCVEKVRKANKPVVALMGSVAASGGYYVAAGADYIVANRLTTTGSIGVIINSYNFYKLLEKIGVDDEVYKSKEMKDILNPARPRTPQEKKIIQALVGESYNEFVEIVSTGRIGKNPKLTASYIKNSPVGDGRILSGVQALKYGLVDELGYFDDARSQILKMLEIKDENYEMITLEKDKSLLDLFQKFTNDNSDINVNIRPLAQNAGISSGKMYYLFTGF